MAGFLYYLPGKGASLKIQDLRAAGLGYTFERSFTPAPLLGSGPDGGQGVIVADDRCVPSAKIGMYADKQVWRKIPQRDVWIGYYTAERPTPGDLIRSDPLPGHLVTLGDDNQWLIPIARGAAEQEDEMVGVCSLPTVRDLDEEGHWMIGGVLPKYERLWQIAQKWWALMCTKISGASTEDDEPVVFDFDGENEAAVDVLTANYRVGAIEAAALGLLNSQTVGAIFMALVDWPTWKKKLDTIGSASTAGQEAGTPDTARR